MQIDWFTFGAQIVNFLILLALLKRFLYGPIVDAMDRREARITDRLRKAQAKEETARQQEERFRQMQADLEAERSEKIAAAEREARDRRKHLLQTARDEVNHLEQEWREALAREQTAFLHDLSERVVAESIALARHALADLADADLEAQSLAVFLRRLHTLDSSAQDDLAAAVQSAEAAVTVRSAFPLADASRERIRKALAALIEAKERTLPTLAFETDDAIGFGIELRAGHRTVGWMLDAYLTDVLDRVRERMEAEAHRTTHPSPLASA